MPHKDLLPSQQAAYVAAHLMDNGSSPRAASKVADISRRDTLALKERQRASGAASCTQQVLLEYLQATRDLGLNDDAREPAAVILAFPVAEPAHIEADLAELAKPRQTGRKHPVPPVFPVGSGGSLLENYMDTLESPEELLKMTIMGHWQQLPGRPLPDQNEFIAQSEWAGTRSRLLDQISRKTEALEESFLTAARIANAESEQHLAMQLEAHLEEELGPAADLLTPAVSHHLTLRASYAIPLPDTAKPPPQLNGWPGTNIVYAELTEPLPHKEGTTIHGVLTGPPPEPRLAAIIIEDRGELWTHLARADLKRGISACTVTEEHDCGTDLHFHIAFCAATAQAISGTLRPEPLTRQQRRRLKRRGWPVPWHHAIPR